MTTIHQLQVKNRQIEYFLTYRNQKNLILKFREGQTLISAPYDCPMWMIKQFVYRNSTKIIQCQTNYQLYKKICWEEPAWILVFNKPVAIELSPIPITTQLIGNKVIIYYNGSQAELTKKLYRFFSQQYKNWFLQRTQQWAKILDVEFKNMSLRLMISKWGICYPQTQKIVYNSKLIHYDPQIIDYVIVHELSHLIHPNHSPSFWYSIQKHLPNYPELKASLKI